MRRPFRIDDSAAHLVEVLVLYVLLLIAHVDILLRAVMAPRLDVLPLSRIATLAAKEISLPARQACFRRVRWAE